MAMDFGAFPSRPVLDGHVHVWAGGDPSALWGTLHRSGAQRCNLLSVGFLEAGRGGTLNAEALRIKRASDGRAYAFGALDYSAHARGERMAPDDLVRQLEAIRGAGFDGVKMWEGKPSLYVRLPDRLEGPLYAPFFARLESLAVPLLMHVADAPRLWDASRARKERWIYTSPEYPTREALYAELERILDRHPRLRLIAAHFNFMWDELDAAARFLDAHPSVAFDLTPGVEGFVQLSENTEAARAFFLQYRDRLIYGSDMAAGPVVDPAMAFDGRKEAGQAWLVRAFLETDWDTPLPPGIGAITNLFAGRRVRGIALPDDVLQQIYGRNFEAMVGAEPRAVQ